MIGAGGTITSLGGDVSVTGHGATNGTLGSNYGEQAQPLVYDGVMFATNAEYTVAIDVAAGKQIWRTAVDWDPETPRVVCCGISNKGPAIYDGKVFRTTLNAFVIALDQKDGKELWRQKVAEWKDGFAETGGGDVRGRISKAVVAQMPSSIRASTRRA